MQPPGPAALGALQQAGRRRTSVNCAVRSVMTSSMRRTARLFMSAENSWSRKTVKPSFSVNWNLQQQRGRGAGMLRKPRALCRA